jgi:hypothetical protein
MDLIEAATGSPQSVEAEAFDYGLGSRRRRVLASRSRRRRSTNGLGLVAIDAVSVPMHHRAQGVSFQSFV